MSSSKISRSGNRGPWEIKPLGERELWRQNSFNSKADAASFFEIEPKVKEATETNGYRDWLIDGVESHPEQWRAELENKALLAEKKGYEEGFKRGQTEGYEAGRRELSGLVGDFLNAIAQLANRREALLKEAEAGLIELALTAAKRIVDQELALNESAAVSIVKAAIKAAVDRERLFVKVNPSFKNVIAAHKEHLQNFVEGIKKITIEGDLSVEPGGCIVETLHGAVDARISSQLEQMKEAAKKASADWDTAVDDKGEKSG